MRVLFLWACGIDIECIEEFEKKGAPRCVSQIKALRFVIGIVGCMLPNLSGLRFGQAIASPH